MTGIYKIRNVLLYHINLLSLYHYINSIMYINSNSNNILSVLDSFMLDNCDDIMMQVAENFRKRRVEKNITRQRIAELSGVPLSTVARFEQKGLIAFESLIKLAMALGYTSEIKDLFSTPKFGTMEELDLIRQKSNDKRAYIKRNKV